MIYFIVLIFSVYSFSFLYVHGKKSFANYIYASVFCIILWTIVQGGQYNVGTDYFTYLYYFDNPYSLSYFSDKGEWGFYFLIKFCHNIGVTGQGVFVVITVRELTLLLPNYSHYAESEYLAEVPFLGKITKVFLLPIYLYSLVVLKSNFLSTREYRLFVVGIIAYSLKNICLVSSVTNRIGFYFMLLSIFPIYYLLRYLQKTRQTKKVYLVYCILILSYCVKVLLFPKGEYSYNSIYNFIYSL